MIRRLPFLALLFFPLSLLAAPLFNSTLVGNGGEGILTDDSRLYTRDLFELSLHENPAFGSESDPHLRAKLQIWNPLALSRQQQSLLLRKLTDIKKAFPPLAFGLVSVLQHYQWSYTDMPLVLLEDESRLQIPTEKRVSIANRYLSSILIQRAEFEKLDDANKVALILHEAIYALVLPQKVAPSLEIEIQSAAFTRQVTALLFSTNLDAESLKPFLEFLSFAKTSSTAKLCNDVELKFQALSMGRFEDTPLRESSSRPFIPAAGDRYPLIMSVFEPIQRTVCESPGYTYAVATLGEAFRLMPRFYRSPHGVQTRLEVATAPAVRMFRQYKELCTEISFRPHFIVSFNEQAMSHTTLCHPN
ncbi:MAG: hypothetical protein KF789_14865 [Bdellovibrionaceae bacterium]|nr:hypothetical protein [Pseudobdellovibrionaceae bacterium]